jgi:hypothetical protein
MEKRTNHKKKKNSKIKKMNVEYSENQDRLEKQIKKLQDRLSEDNTCVSRKYVEYLSSLVRPGQTSVQPFMTREICLDVIPLPLSNGFSLDKVLGIDGAGQQTPNTDIGKFAYTCIFYGPLLTSISDGAKISGFNALAFRTRIYLFLVITSQDWIQMVLQRHNRLLNLPFMEVICRTLASMELVSLEQFLWNR